MIEVRLSYGNGGRSAGGVSHVLILDEKEGIKRGEAELNQRRLKVLSYDFRIHYPTNGHLIRPGTYIRITSSRLGLVAEDLYVKKVSLSGLSDFASTSYLL